MRSFLRKPGFLLARVDQICTAIFARLSGTATLNQTEFILLLGRLGPMIQIELAAAAGVDKSTTAYILDNLQTHGWTQRTVREGDRRSSLVSLTSEGESALPQLRTDFADLQGELTSLFEPREQARLTAYLHRLARMEEVPAPYWRAACDPAAGVLDLSISFLARRALQIMHGYFLSETRGTRLTLRQFSLLFILSRRPSITQTEFARLFGLDPATCAVIMRGPAQRGLIRGERSAEDGRAKIYSLTEEGAATLKKVHPLVDRSQERAFAAFPGDEREVIVEWLLRIVTAHSAKLRFPGAITGS